MSAGATKSDFQTTQHLNANVEFTAIAATC